MSRCQVCNLIKSKRLELERAYLNNQSQAMLSREYDVTEDSIRNHMQNHVSRQLATSVEMQRALESGTLITELEDTLREMKEIVVVARKDKNYRLVLDALKAKMGPIELYSRMLATAHMMRAQELQAQQSQQEDSSSREHQEGLERLSDGELDMLVGLHQKMSGERTDNIIEAVMAEIKHSCHEWVVPAEIPKRSRSRRKIIYAEDEPEWDEDRERQAVEEERALKAESEQEAIGEALETLDDLTVSPLEGVDLSAVKKAGTWGDEAVKPSGPGHTNVRTSPNAEPQLKKLLGRD